MYNIDKTADFTQPPLSDVEKEQCKKRLIKGELPKNIIVYYWKEKDVTD